MSTQSLQQIKQIIRQRSDLFEKNFAEGNAAQLVLDYYVPDALEPVVSAPDAPAVVGRAAITTLFEGFVAGFGKARQVARFIRADGNLAYEVSNSYLTPRGGGGELEFRYIATWRRCEDTWRVEADFFALGALV